MVINNTAKLVISKVCGVTAPRARAPPVIELGAPRHARAARAPYTPNQRLYPPAAPQRKPRARRAAPQPRRRVRVPNARLYRPAPPRAARPPPRPARLPPEPARVLDTASRAALRLAERRAAPPAQPRNPTTLHPAPHAQAAGARARARRAPPPPARRSLDTDSDSGGAPRSPEPASDGSDQQQAPSEFLAEFLSAVMRRQHAEALRYCRLILQYEPRNATARGFYPLLRRRAARALSDTDRSSGRSSPEPDSSRSASPCSSPSPPPAGGGARHSTSDSSGSSTAAGGVWADDNGNELRGAAYSSAAHRVDDVENDNTCGASSAGDAAAAAPAPPRKAARAVRAVREARESLRRLRAQFAAQ